MKLYDKTAFEISKIIIKRYSTSFYLASLFFEKEIRTSIFNIYGFVRLADEIVDTFHSYNKEELLNNFENDINKAIKEEISINPIIHSFMLTVKKYDIPEDYIKFFLNSMRLDIIKNKYLSQKEIKEYIYGSAEVVGLMCLKVFCNKDDSAFNEQKDYAIKLGSAFQKVNFLRDLKNDLYNLNRIYFPELKDGLFNETIKESIIDEIEKDFAFSYQGITKLKGKSKLAVLISFFYYNELLKKIKKTPAESILEKRLRVNNFRKIFLTLKAYFVFKLNLL